MLSGNQFGLAVVALVGLFTLAGCTSETEDSRNLVLITMDTTRADYLGCYGRSVGSTPNIDRLAARGTVFDRAFSVAPITGPSHASILTGTYPPYHLMRDNGASVLDKGLPTVGELFQARGHRTAGIVAAYPVKGIFGFSRGFDYFSDTFDTSAESIFVTNLPAVGVERRKGEMISNEFIAWLEHHDDRPFFAWLHYYDPHMPYEAPAEFNQLFPGEPYDAEIAYMDQSIGRITRAIEERGMAEQTGYVLVADHGEGLGEHDELTHAILTYNTTIRVPLIVDLPWIEGQPARIAGNVSTIDLLPTIVDAFDLDRGTEGLKLHGRSLFPALSAEPESQDLHDRSLYFESMFPYLHYRWGTLKGFVRGPWKIISGPDAEVYNIEEDFDELTPIIEPERTSDFGRELEVIEARISEGRSEPTDRPLDRETRKNLEALGYVGGSGGEEEIDDLDLGGLPIPRDQMDEWMLFNQATTLARSGEISDAVGLTKKIIAENPQHKDAKLLLASIYLKTRDFSNADRTYDELLRNHPDLDVLYPAARYYLHIRKDYQRAISCCRSYLELAPDDHEALVLLGSGLEKENRPEAAADAYDQALRTNPKSRDALIRLGILLSRENRDLERAEELLERAVEFYPFDPVTNFNYGIFMAKAGDETTAVDLLIRSSAFAAEGVFSRAHFALASIARQRGEFDKAESYLQDIIRTTHDPIVLRQAHQELSRTAEDAGTFAP